MEPRVSIIIPCYNAEPWLAETLESVASQTWQNSQIILVDDGSSDASVQIASRYPQITIIQQKRQGGAAARNVGLSRARGEFIQFLDSDDLLGPEKIEEQVKVLAGGGVGTIAVSPYAYFTDGRPPSASTLVDSWPIVDSNNPLEWYINLLGPDKHGSMVPLHSWLIPRDLAERAGPWDESLTMDQDGEYFCRVVLKSDRIRRSRRGLAYYRKHTVHNSVSKGGDRRHHLSALRALDSKAQRVLALTDDVRARRALARHYCDRAYSAYPRFPGIANTAMNQAKALSQNVQGPQMGPRAEALKALFGWKVSKIVSVVYHRMLGILLS